MPRPTTAIGVLTANGRKPRVAVVDGNPASARVVSLLVEGFGCAALKAADGEAALAFLRRTDNVDLILIDLAIPDLDCIVLIRETAKHRDVPIVLLATTQTGLRLTAGRAAGFADVLMKPYSPRQLHAAMSAALARKGTTQNAING